MKHFLPIILIFIFLTLGIVLALVSRTPAGREMLRFGIAPNKLETPIIISNDTNTSNTPNVALTPIITVTPSVNSVDPVAPLISPTPTIVSPQTTITTNTTKIITKCTNGYGQPCGEHVVVDTGIENEIFYALAAITYFGGLTAFMLGKRKI